MCIVPIASFFHNMLNLIYGSVSLCPRQNTSLVHSLERSVCLWAPTLVFYSFFQEFSLHQSVGTHICYKRKRTFLLNMRYCSFLLGALASAALVRATAMPNYAEEMELWERYSLNHNE